MIFACLSLFLAGGPVRGGGFLIYEHGASATGMANARSALAGDVSAIFFNPAAITELPGLQLSLGLTGILPRIHYEPAGGAPSRTYPSYRNGQYVELPVNDGQNPLDAKLHLFTPIHLYASWQIPESSITLGFGLFNPFGLGTFWRDDWDGRFLAVDTEIRTFFNQPCIAWDLAQVFGLEGIRLSVAAGYNLVFGTANLSRKMDLRIGEVLSMGSALDPEGRMDMEGFATGHGLNLALWGQIDDLLSFGFSWRSSVVMSFEGEARFAFNPAGQKTLGLLGMTMPDTTDASVEITLPHNINAGIAFLGIPDLTIALDVYGAFFESYDELALTFDCVEAGACSDVSPDPSAKNWGSSWQIALGVEYWLAPAWAIRAGYAHVTSPVPASTYDPSLPDGKRHLVSAGLGYRGQGWSLDLGYMLGLWQGTKDNLVGSGDHLNPEGRALGTYTTQSHILAISGGLSFL